MARERTGTVKYVPAKPGEMQGHYAARITTPDGKRPWIHFDPGPKSPEALERAKDRAKHWTERAWREGVGATPADVLARVSTAARSGTAGETVSKWFARWKEHRATKIRSADDDESIFRNYIEGEIGALPIREVTRTDIERIRDRLDALIRQRIAFEAKGESVSAGRKPGISAKTAINVWGVVLGIFRDARSSKLATLRVRDDNPTAEVAAPDDHPEKDGPFLYPSEFLRFAACEAIPLRARRMVTIAIYLGTRSGEERALAWGDIDFVHHKVAITKQVSRKTGEIATTKTASARWPDLEATLVPLLRAMASEATRHGAEQPDEGASVTWMPPEEDQASLLRKWLLVAGVTRRDLHTETPTTRPLSFHDCRHTCATWMAAQGRSAFEIMQRTGHKNLATVQRYVERFGNVNRATFGAPFPTLPRALLAPSNRPGNRPGVPSRRVSGGSHSMNLATPTGVEGVRAA